jgi:hypothetical protein
MSKVINLVAYKDDKSKNSILRIVGSYSKFGVGYVPKGESGVQHDGGPQVPGPWAFAYELSHTLTNDPVEVKEAKAKDEFDRTTYIESGDKVKIDGYFYEVSILSTINCGYDIDFKKL